MTSDYSEPLKSAVIPLDLHEPEERIRGVLTLMERLGLQTFRLLHVASSAGAGRRGAPRLEELVKGLQEEISVSSQILTGSPPVEILQGAAAWNADLIAIPWKHKNWLQRSLVGSVTRDILRMNDRSTLVFRPSGGRSGAPLHVVFATDFHRIDDVVTPVFARSGLSIGKLHIFHAGERAPDPKAEEERRHSVTSRLNDIAGTIRDAYRAAAPLDIEVVDHVGSPRREVVKFVSTVTPDLVIVGKGRREKRSSILGSVAEEIAYRASSSVLIIPPGA